MKKRIIWFAAVLAFLSVALSGCSESPAIGTTTTPSLMQGGGTQISETATITENGTTNIGASPQSTTPTKTNNELLYEQLTQTRYDANEILYPWTTFNIHGTYHTFMADVNERFPIECLRDMGNGHYYAVYETTEGGRLFYFFDGARNFEFTHSVYIFKPVAENVYMQLKPGDSTKKVLEMDSAFASAMKKGQATNTVMMDDIQYSFALLENALIVVRYSVTGDTGDVMQDVTVSEIQVFPDKKLIVGKEVKNLQAAERPQQIREVFDFNILPQDFPK